MVFIVGTAAVRHEGLLDILSLSFLRNFNLSQHFLPHVDYRL
jgi:hypothetical protein